MWPKCAFGDQKGLIRKKDMPFGNPPYRGTIRCGIFSKRFFAFYGSKMVFWVKKRRLGVFWTECEVADLKQRQRIAAMDHRNKIQSLVLPADGPGDAPD